MKTAILLLSALIVSFVFSPQYGLAQESTTSEKEQRKLEKEKKKQEKEAAALVDREMYAQMLQNKQFVFMANTLAGDAGRTFPVTPKFNFLVVYDEQVVFQFAFDGVVGWNGIGGITMKGEIEDYRFDPGKNINKPMKVNARVKANTQWGKPYFTLTVFGEGYANITMTVKGATINMSGQLVSLEESDVYIGNVSIYD